MKIIKHKTITKKSGEKVVKLTIEQQGKDEAGKTTKDRADCWMTEKEFKAFKKKIG